MTNGVGVRAALAALMVPALSCDDGRDTSDRCVAGRTVSCPCSGGGAGVQTCGPDGTFAPCRCPRPADAGAPEDAGADAGPTPVDAGRDAGPPPDADGGASDAGPDCDESPCRLVNPQCGCLSEEGCYLEPDLGRVCAPAGVGKSGEACVDQVDCAPGHACLGAGRSRWCRLLCEVDVGCFGGPGVACVLDVRLDAGEDPVARACTLSCEPSATTGCPDDSACRLFGAPSGAVFTDCREAGASSAGAPCVEDADCAPSLFCADFGGGDQRCTRYCRVGATDCPLSICTSFTEAVVLGGTEYGFCP